MAIPFISYEAICKSQLNTSLSKQMYSFPKAQRFSPSHTPCTSSFYEMPSTRSFRYAGIGYGPKTDIFTSKRTNSPFYDIQRLYDDKKNEAPSFSFGLGRDKFRKVVIDRSYLNTEYNINPGPGMYSTHSSFGEGPRYTCRIKPIVNNKGSYLNVPGPGRYDDKLRINTEGRYVISRYKNTESWSVTKDKRFKPLKIKTPGPGKYDIKGLINGKGQIYNSKFTSGTAKTMSSKYKNERVKKDETPGPGAYQTFSEFGIYRSRNINDNKRHTTTKSNDIILRNKFKIVKTQ